MQVMNVANKANVFYQKQWLWPSLATDIFSRYWFVYKGAKRSKKI